MKRLLGFLPLTALSFALVLSACGSGAEDNTSCKPSASVQQIVAQKISPMAASFSGINSASAGRTLMGGANQGTALNTNGYVTTLAGTAGSYGSTDGTGAAARFFYPQCITTDGTNLFVAVRLDNTIRKVAISTGVVTTLAGTAGSTGSTDGAGAAARFYYPAGITTDGTNLYVADSSSHTIRKIVIATGVVTTFAGTAGSSGSTDGMGTAARFNKPYGLTTDGTNLYVADTTNSTIRKIVIATGVVTTLAGTAGSSGSTDGTGTAARFNKPDGLTTDGTNLYVADTTNSTIRKIVIATGVVTTLAGTAGSSGSTDGTGTAARFYFPSAVTMDGTNLYVADMSNHTIRKIVIATGVVTTLAGTAGSAGSTDGMGTAARFNYPDGLTTDGTNLYVADMSNHTIRTIGYYGAGSVANAPTGLTYTSATHALSWISAMGATSYIVNCVDTTSGASLAPITVTANYYDGFSTTSSATYSCTVKSVNAYGTSSASSSTTVGITAASTTTTTTSACTNPTTPSTATYYYANWSCGSSTQCASVMGGSSGSAGPICSSADCDAWGAKYIPAGYSCSTTATYTVTAQASSAANGVCFKNGVDF